MHTTTYMDFPFLLMWYDATPRRSSSCEAFSSDCDSDDTSTAYIHSIISGRVQPRSRTVMRPDRIRGKRGSPIPSTSLEQIPVQPPPQTTHSSVDKLGAQSVHTRPTAFRRQMTRAANVHAQHRATQERASRGAAGCGDSDEVNGTAAGPRT